MLELRVIYGDTDQMGVVYYANYLRYFEAARGDFLRRRDWSYAKIEALGVILPVTEAYVRYRRSAKYDDLITINPVVTQVRGVSFRFDYTIKRGEELLADGFTGHAALSKSDGKPMKLPDEMRALLESAKESP